MLHDFCYRCGNADIVLDDQKLLVLCGPTSLDSLNHIGLICGEFACLQGFLHRGVGALKATPPLGALKFAIYHPTHYLPFFFLSSTFWKFEFQYQSIPFVEPLLSLDVELTVVTSCSSQ